MTDCYLLDSVKGQIENAVKKELCTYTTNEKVDENTWQNKCDREKRCV